MTKWPLQDAKNRLSEVVRKASAEGPQVITLRGEDAVVVIAANEYAQLVHERTLALDLTRDPDTGRAVTL